jgi:myo-inositol-1(or 4)-monophosphatase
MIPSHLIDLPEALAAASKTAVAAGEIAMRFFRPGERTSATIWEKAGGSPVTEADIAVDDFLKQQCRRQRPDAAWLSEETADDAARLGRSLVWVVDPIDGTRAFMAGSPDWCVCVALLAGDQPVMGVVHAPALGLTYTAVAGSGAARNGARLAVSVADRLANARIAGPKPMLDVLARGAPISAQPKVPSLALRLARIADGQLDGGLVSPDARDWDLAAADLVLREAGGRVSTLDGAALRYNRPNPVHATLVAAAGSLHEPLRLAALALRETSPFAMRRG